MQYILYKASLHCFLLVCIEPGISFTWIAFKCLIIHIIGPNIVKKKVTVARPVWLGGSTGDRKAADCITKKNTPRLGTMTNYI